MNTLEKELVKNGKSTIDENQNLVNDLKLLLSTNAQEEINTLKSIGLDNDIRFIQDKQEDVIMRKKIKTSLDRDVVHHDEIRNLCIKYRLYMRPARDYKGRIPSDLGAELVRYCKEKNITLPSNSSYSNFFVIAPPKMFDGYRTPLENVNYALNLVKEKEKERKRLRDLDPILVYQVEKDKPYYAIIKSWGQDFTPLRRLYGMFTTKTMAWVMSFSLLILGLGILTKLAVWQSFYFLSISVDKHNPLPMVALTFINAGLLIVAGLWTFHTASKNFREELRSLTTYREIAKWKERNK